MAEISDIREKTVTKAQIFKRDEAEAATASVKDFM